MKKRPAKVKISKVKTGKYYRRIVIAFIGVTVLLVLLIAYFSFSWATISISLKPEPVATTQEFQLKEELTADESQSGNFLKGRLKTNIQAGSKTFTNPAEATGALPAKAEGRVTIYNNWTKIQPLQTTTRLLSKEGILFRTKARVDVPAGGKLENVQVIADQEGAQGNIGPSKFEIVALWPGLKDKIYAESFESMTGGLKNVKLITTEEINKRQDELGAELETKALDELAKELSAGEKILPKAALREILEESSSVEAGTEAESFEISMKIKVIAAIFDEKTLLEKLATELGAGIPQNKALAANQPKELDYSLEKYDLNSKIATLKASLEGTMAIQSSHPIFNRAKLTNKSKQEIINYFSGFNEIKTAEVKFSPFWVFRSPSLKSQLEIKIIE